MDDPQLAQVAYGSIFALVQNLAVLVDLRFLQLRKGSPTEKMRLSDMKVFVEACRKPRTEAEIARVLQISRQAVQSSVKRLVAQGLIKLVAHNNRRDKLVMPTELGEEAQKSTASQMIQIDQECARIIGNAQELEVLRAQLNSLKAGLGKATGA